MKHLESLTSCVLLASSIFASACRGQERAGSATQNVDPALVATVDSMVPKLEVLAGLTKLQPIALAQQSRADLRKYVEARLAEEMPPSEMEGVRQTYVQLGLIPDTLNLRELFLNLYEEQVAGYYDPVSNKFYVIAGTPVGLLRPVLAHELVHALQDQHDNLDSLMSRARGNDHQSAAQAAIEGQATVVMFAYLAQQGTGHPVEPAALPDIGAQLEPALDAQNSQFPVFKSAPRIIRETMIFPYVAGASFVQKLWLARHDLGYPAPFGSLLPQSTEQVMHPVERFLTNRDAPTDLRLSGIEGVVYENTMGEFETAVLLSQFLGIAEDSAAAGWDGDRYVLVKRADGKRMIVWQSVWDDAASADRFAKNYRAIAARRSDRAIRVERNRVQDGEGVLVIDAEQGIDVKAVNAPSVGIVVAPR